MNNAERMQKEILSLVQRGEMKPELAAKLLRSLPKETSSQPSATKLSPIAVIGMAGRFPEADDVQGFWENLASGKDSVRPVPARRFWPHTANETSDVEFCKQGGFLDRVDQFDPLFFDISPREAELMDPQQRIFLEESWRAFEDAGLSAEYLNSRECGVFVGATPGDYKVWLGEKGHKPEAFTLVGNDEAILAARVSYLMNLKGPCFTVNTACSSSLIAFCLACDSLNSGQCDVALVGGVSIYSTQQFHLEASRAGILSPKGKCKTFDDSADGFVPGEAVGALVLKRLEDALRDGDRIHGVVDGWGMNQDGRSNGITAPNAVSQTELIRKVSQRFSINPDTISYVETHGTGTKLGDPIEVAALTDAFGSRKSHPLLLGSVKTNVGHPFAAAGVTGLIKILLCLKHKQLPASLHFKTENRHIDLSGAGFEVCRELRSWKHRSNDEPLRAALNSFGFSGSNTHVVLSEAPKGNTSDDEVYRGPFLIPVSAKTHTALKRRIRDLIDWIQSHPEASLRDISYSLSARWTHHSERRAIVAHTTDEALNLLEKYLKKLQSESDYISQQRRPSAPVTGLFEQKAGSLTQEDWIHFQKAYESGQDLPWHSLFKTGRLLDLPKYPFELESYWFGVEPFEAEIRVAPRLPAAKRSIDPIPAFIEMISSLEEYARPRLARQLVALGWDGTLQRTKSREALAEELNVTPEYFRLFSALIDLLVESRYLVLTHGDLSPSPRWSDALSQKLPSELEVQSIYSEAARYLPLLTSCLDQLPQVLTRQVNITQVMFPEGSMKLVEPTYYGDPIRDHFNLEVANRLQSLVADRVASGQSIITILELGAGTGATSAVVLRGLHAFEGRIRYIYTDVSPTFLTHGENLLRGEYPWIEFQTLDIERPFESQGIERSSVDIALASNVVHAVQNVTESIGHVNQVLSENGAVVLNEITATNDLTTLTFGLTPGWWRFEDSSLRVPNSPLLSEPDWVEVLKSVGFGNWKVNGLPSPENKFKQRLITAFKNAATEVRAKATSDAGLPAILSKSESASQSDLEKTALKIVSELLGTTVKLDPARIHPERTLEVYGVDSLVAVELTKKLQNQFGTLPSTLLFERPTCGKLAQYFVENHQDRLLNIISKNLPAPAVATTKHNQSVQVTERISLSEIGEDIAIVGLSGKYPQSPDLETFWNNLSQGRNCIEEIPVDRWDWKGQFDPVAADGKSYSRWGGFLQDVDKFDPLFFNIAPRDAVGMDPQERLFIETVWRLMEDAGYTPKSIHQQGASVGVFAGVMNSDYSQLAMERPTSTGQIRSRTAYWSLGNRISYLFDFQGPSLAIDSACSSSLTAIHLACNSLKLGECDMAIAGGVNLILHPSKYVELCRLGMLASDNRCKSFGAGADGFVDGEGVGAVLLRPLKAALKARDRIYGVIKASVINAGGKTSGYTVPNPNAQADLVEKAISKAGLQATDISYIEAHGTGTELGDPIELAALKQAFRKSSSSIGFCALGSVKSNIGHLEAAAGIAGLTKVLLQLKHRQIAPSLHCEDLNPKLDLNGAPFVINRELRSWKSSNPDGILRAGMSSFGAGGANAHLIVEQAPDQPTSSSTTSSGPKLFLISARTESDLFRMAKNYVQFLDQLESDQFENLCYTLQIGRAPLAYTLPLIGESILDIQKQLRHFLDTANVDACLRPSEIYHPESAEELLTSDEPPTQATLFRLAQLWADGADVAWLNLYCQEPFRIAAPCYEFQGQRRWLGAHSSSVDLDPPASHELAQKKSPAETDEFLLEPDDLLVRDHRVGGRPVMPGVGYIAALASKTKGAPLSVQNLFWLAPLVVEGKTRLQLHWSEEKSGEAFEFKDELGRAVARGSKSSSVTHPDPLPNPSTGSQNYKARRFIREEIDELFQSVNIKYGPYFQTLKQAAAVQSSMGYGELKAADQQTASFQTSWIHPGILDGALQMVGCFMASDAQPMLPYSMGSFHLMRPMTNEMRVIVRRTSDFQFDLDLVSSQNERCVAIRDFVVRPVPDPMSDFFYTPNWEVVDRHEINSWLNDTGSEQSRSLILYTSQGQALARNLESQLGERFTASVELSSNGFDEIEEPSKILESVIPVGQKFQRVILLSLFESKFDSDSDSTEAMTAFQRAGVESIYRWLRCLQIHPSLDNNAHFHLATRQIYSVFDSDPVQPWGADIVGLCKSAAKEMPNSRWSFIDIDDDSLRADGIETDSTIWKRIMVAPLPNADLAVRHGQLYRRRLTRIQLPKATQEVFRNHGVYIIAGGAGGIGNVFSHYLAENFQARLVWLGRSSRDQHLEKIAAVQKAGAELEYIQCDITQPGAVSKAVEQVKSKWGAIHGVIHSAIFLKDQSLNRIDKKSFRASMTVKAQGSQSLFHALRHEALDFFLFFSSGQSFVCNPGQASYAAACTFKDAYAAYMSRNSKFPVKVINWGYWGEVGIVSDEANNRRMKERGIHSISPEDGIEAARRILAGSVQQVLPIRAQQAALEAMGLSVSPAIQFAPATFQLDTGSLEKVRRQPSAKLFEFQKAYKKLQRLGSLKLLNIFRKSGVFDSESRPLGLKEIQEALKVESPRRKDLLNASLDLLCRNQLILHVDHAYWVTPKVSNGLMAHLVNVDQDWDRLVNSHPEIEGFARLLSKSLDAFLDVLSGRRLGTDVLFPGGSIELVERIYHNNPIADWCNSLCVDAVNRALEQMTGEGRRIRILEIGAGTGGVSKAVLKATQKFGALVDYIYTDVSPVFMKVGSQISETHPQVTPHLMDVTSELACRAWRGSVDIVIAANVLHATQDLRKTMRNVKSMMKRNGLLILNELTQVQDFTTLTFGLLEDWWPADHLRLPNSPLLDRAKWSTLCREEGWRNFRTINSEIEPVDLGQDVMVAVSDGRILESINEVQIHPTTNPAKDLPIRKIKAKTASPTQVTSDLKSNVVNVVLKIVSEVLEIEVKDLELDTSHSEFGVDSILAIEMVRRINSDLGADLQVTDFFNYSTLRELTQHLLDENKFDLEKLEPLTGANSELEVEEPPVENHSKESALLDVFEQVRAGALDIETATLRIQELEA